MRVHVQCGLTVADGWCGEDQEEASGPALRSTLPGLHTVFQVLINPLQWVVVCIDVTCW
jgi:hypothetical protein